MSTIIPNQERITYGVQVELVTEICCSCAMPFAVPLDFQRRRVQDGKSFHCPNGHSQSYSESEISRLKKQLESRERIISEKQADINYWNEKFKGEQLSKRTIKGHHTRLKNKIQQGICPCCDQKFTDLAAHMENEHPDFHNAKQN